MREFVHDPMKTESTFDAIGGRPGAGPMQLAIRFRHRVDALTVDVGPGDEGEHFRDENFTSPRPRPDEPGPNPRKSRSSRRTK